MPDMSSEIVVTKIRKPGEAAFTFGLLAFSLLALWLSYGISGLASISAPGTLPMLASVVLVASSLTISRQVWAMPPPLEGESFFRLMTPLRWVNFFLLGMAYILLLTFVGFVPATFLYLFVSIVYLHKQGWLMAFFVSANSLAIIYMVFQLVFKVILPEGVLEL